MTPLPLIQQKEVPDDATVVVIAGPTTDFLQPEIDAMKRYVAKGGKVLALIDPPAAGAADPAEPDRIPEGVVDRVRRRHRR